MARHTGSHITAICQQCQLCDLDCYGNWPIHGILLALVDGCESDRTVIQCLKKQKKNAHGSFKQLIIYSAKSLTTTNLTWIVYPKDKPFVLKNLKIPSNLDFYLRERYYKQKALIQTPPKMTGDSHDHYQ